MTVFEIFNFDEGTTPLYQVTLQDENGVAIPDSDLDTLTLTYYDRDTGEIINSRDDQNALNANDVVVSGGAVSWRLQVEDAVILDSDNEYEHRIGLWQWTYSPGAVTLEGKHEARFRVRNLAKVS